MKFLDRLDLIAARLERFVAGSGPSSGPLYMSNRSRAQKLRVVLLIGVPAVAAVALIVLALNNYFAPAPGTIKPMPTVRVVPGEITASVLPELEKNYRSQSDVNCSVIEAGINGETLSGKLRNETDREIHAADLVFDITDEIGSQVGAVAVHVETIAPHAVVPFSVVLAHRRGKAALVREIHTR